MKIKFLLFAFALTSFISCKTNQLIHSSAPGNEMFKVAILYSNGEGKTFDLDYYEKKHMPMVAKFLGENLKFYEIDEGIASGIPNNEVPFLAIGYFYIKDVAAYNRAIGKNIEAVRNDIQNYTNIRPIIQISEVKQLGIIKEK